MPNPDPPEPMPRYRLILLTCLLALAGTASASERPDTATRATARPLNLSLPRDLLLAPGAGEAEDAAQRNLAPPQSGRSPGGAASHPASLPYGAGYEHRHPQAGNVPTDTAPRPGGGNAGAGRRGR
jgi:hypothetical protein